MARKAKTKVDLFLALAKPDALGFSRAVPVDEFVGDYAVLQLGNGGSWCRTDGALGRKYNIRRNKGGNAIVSVELQGYKKQPIGKRIPIKIKREVVKRRCVILGVSSVECDHKDGRLDDPRLDDPKRITADDFQPLSKAANNAKRQHCKSCRASGNRYDARVLGYKMGQVLGNGKYNGTCVGCYWHDPHFFNAEASKRK